MSPEFPGSAWVSMLVELYEALTKKNITISKLLKNRVNEIERFPQSFPEFMPTVYNY